MDKGKPLESWKAIAAYLGRNVRTCQLWERDHGLPIQRLGGTPKARVLAYPEELDRWLEEKLLRCGAGYGQPKSRARANSLPTLPALKKGLIAALSAVTLAAVAASALLIERQARMRWANNTAIPEIERLLLTPEKERAYELAARVERIAPTNPHVPQLMSLVSGKFSVATDPPGAELSVRPYGGSDESWQVLGRTPVADRRLSSGPKHWRIALDGYAPAEGTAFIVPGETETARIRLDPDDAVPAGMVRIPGESIGLLQYQIRFSPRLRIADFWIDRFEVSNDQFKSFVDSGGYADRRYWKEPFTRDGRTLSWEEAMTAFVDRTGRPGPATWESGVFPAGRGGYPVTGVSWYEAAA
ncbi:MAG: serine/threonine protein kinase, partial [Candidatus Aminicenantes bacterium]|nr:serine/threonine protein kinase [Candidatus Aminicenantes bacterium]